MADDGEIITEAEMPKALTALFKRVQTDAPPDATDVAGFTLFVRRTRNVLRNDVMCRGQVLRSKLPEHADGRGWRRGAMRISVV